MIFVETFGTPSFLGEVWYAEADSPIGPWVYARKVVTHDRYSFYNPKIHDEFSDSRHIYFEGTYTTTFSGNPIPTPRYEYNQIMYRLDRDDPRLFLPVAVRSVTVRGRPRSPGGAARWRSASSSSHPIGRRPGCVPVLPAGDLDGGLTLATPPQSGARPAEPLFYALPADIDPPQPSTVLLFEYTTSSGRKAYAVDGQSPGPDFRRAAAALPRVWAAPGVGRG